MIIYQCPHCGEPMESPDSLAGESDMCTSCDRRCVVPGATATKRQPERPRSRTGTPSADLPPGRSKEHRPPTSDLTFIGWWCMVASTVNIICAFWLYGSISKALRPERVVWTINWPAVVAILVLAPAPWLFMAAVLFYLRWRALQITSERER